MNRKVQNVSWESGLVWWGRRQMSGQDRVGAGEEGSEAGYPKGGLTAEYQTHSHLVDVVPLDPQVSCGG